MTCPHRKQMTRIDGEGRYFIHCHDCGLDGRTRDTVTDAFLHRKEDLRDAEALRAAEAEKTGQG